MLHTREWLDLVNETLERPHADKDYGIAFFWGLMDVRRELEFMTICDAYGEAPIGFVSLYLVRPEW